MKQLHKKTQIEVQKLLDDTGHVLNLGDISDILELDELAHRVTSTSGDYSDICTWPVRCGSVLLRPLTLGKIKWYNERGLVWFGEDDENAGVVLAFLMSIDNDESFVWSLACADDAKRAIDEWGRTVDVTPRRLSSAVSSVLGSSGGEGSDDKSDYGPLIALLCREYGNSPDYWMYRAEVHMIESLVGEYVRKINDEIRASNRTAKGKRSHPSVKTPSMEASHKFRLKMINLESRWRNGG